MFQWYFDFWHNYYSTGLFADPASWAWKDNLWKFIPLCIWVPLVIVVGSWIDITGEEDPGDAIPAILATMVFGGLAIYISLPLLLLVGVLAAILFLWYWGLESARGNFIEKKKRLDQLTAELALKEEEIFEAKKELDALREEGVLA